LHKIIPGGADRSYGIHVAQLAGLPKSVVVRAEEVLAELESQASKKSKVSGRKAQQLPLLPKDSLLTGEIAKLDVDSLSPLEAITKLYELKQMAQEK
jgi:DNA mismatch repair protein MutS